MQMLNKHNQYKGVKLLEKFIHPFYVWELNDDRKTYTSPAHDRSPLWIFHIMNEKAKHPELMDTFLDGNYGQIFRKIIKWNAAYIS